MGMQNDPSTTGVREDAASFVDAPTNLFHGAGRFRRFGEEGPIYEVLSVGADTVRIHVLDNGEELDYRIDRARTDPIAA